MKMSLKDFLAERKVEIRTTITALRKEYKEIQAAEKAVGYSLEASNSYQIKKRDSSRPTVKEMILNVLSGKSKGDEAINIINSIKEKYGYEIPRPSMSTQLSRLKTEGELLLVDGKLWKSVSNEAILNESVVPSTNVGQDPCEAEDNSDYELMRELMS